MRTLVLNAGYEPLAVVTFRRALVLVLTGKASVVAEGDDPVVGPQDILGRPSVILLNRYIRPRYNTLTAVSRRGVLRRDSHRCAYCGKAAHTIDHVQPKSRGGADSWENLVAACLRCNNAKGDHTPGRDGLEARVRSRAAQGHHLADQGTGEADPGLGPVPAPGKGALGTLAGEAARRPMRLGWAGGIRRRYPRRGPVLPAGRRAQGRADGRRRHPAGAVVAGRPGRPPDRRRRPRSRRPSAGRA